MSKPTGEGLAAAERPSVQPIVSHNVRILMAYRGVQQQGIGFVIGKTANAVGHKLAGRSGWTLDEVEGLAEFGGPKWPVSRFFVDPERETEGPKSTVGYIATKLAASTPKPDRTNPVRGHLTAVH